MTLGTTSLSLRQSYFSNHVSLSCDGVVVESLVQNKVGAMAAKTSLDLVFVQYKYTVMDEISGNYLKLP